MNDSISTASAWRARFAGDGVALTALGDLDLVTDTALTAAWSIYPDLPALVACDDDAIRVAACLVASARLDDLAQCRAILARYWRDSLFVFSGTLLDASTYLLETGAAEAWCALGEPSHARVHASRALNFADGPFQQSKSKALSALSSALHGDIGGAVTLLSESDLPDGSELDSVVRGIYPRALARILIASACADARELRDIATDLRHLGEGVDYRRIAAEAALVHAMILEGAVDEGIASGTALLSLGARAGQAMVRALLASVIFDAYLIRGEPRRALAVLEAQPAPPGSATCANVQRAYAYSLMRDDRRVLRETSECMAQLTGHGIRVMVPLAIVRGLSCFRLGQFARARRYLIDGLQLAFHAEISFTSFIGLDAGDLKRALLSLDGISPELRSMVAGIVEFIDKKGGKSASVSIPPLTVRERELAWGLYHALSNSELASSAGSSVNTVKAQLRTLYKKLHVTDRKGAVEYLDARDFFLDGEEAQLLRDPTSGSDAVERPEGRRVRSGRGG